jgi:predicted ATPase
VKLAGNAQTLTHTLTSFVGRSDAIDKMSGLLDRYRLVTVTGPGGVGKTRLAAEVLRQVADRFADGVWVVELAAVQEAALVPAAVATALGLQHSGGGSIVDALAARLSREQVLLVLDNCEHVLDAVAELCASVLPAADDIRILATSREPLGVPGEARYRLPPLLLPDDGAPDQSAPAEAVSLFVERARQLDPDLNLDGESRPVVERLVRRLDGMPLAIELAAARVESLGLVQLLDLLNDRFGLLVSANPKLRLVRQSILILTWYFAGLGGWCFVYFKMSGIGTSRSSKASRCALVGSASMGTVAGVPAKRTWLRVRVARWSIRPRKLR